MGNYTDALKILNDMILIDSNDIVAINKKGETLYYLNRFEEAENCFKKVISYNGNGWFPEVINNLGVLYWRMGNKKAALELMETGFEVYKGSNVDIMTNYSRMMHSCGEKKFAERLLNLYWETYRDDRVIDLLTEFKSVK